MECFAFKYYLLKTGAGIWTQTLNRLFPDTLIVKPSIYG